MLETISLWYVSRVDTVYGRRTCLAKPLRCPADCVSNRTWQATARSVKLHGMNSVEHYGASWNWLMGSHHGHIIILHGYRHGTQYASGTLAFRFPSKPCVPSFTRQEAARQRHSEHAHCERHGVSDALSAHALVPIHQLPRAIWQLGGWPRAVWAEWR